MLTCCLVFTAPAQQSPLADATNPKARIEAPEEVAVSLAGELAALPSVSAERMKFVDKQFALALKAGADRVRVRTLQDIIFLANQHGDRVAFRKVVSPLLNVYLFDKNDNDRIMAVTALHALGDRYGMRRLRETLRDVKRGPGAPAHATRAQRLLRR